MVTGNNQISGRQAMRLLTFDLLGYSTLAVPSVLAQTVERDGIFSIIIGIGGGFLYLWLLKAVTGEWNGSFGEQLIRNFGKPLGTVIKFCYYFYFILLAGRVAAMFAELVVEELLEKQFRLILVFILALVYYGVSGGIEGRARVYEILFWILLVPLFGMMVFALPAVDTDYWTPIFFGGVGNILKGGYFVFLGIPALSVIPFLSEHISGSGQVYRCAKRALFWTGGILIVLYLILLGMFGAKGLKTLDYPVVTMMSRIQMTGGFLKRTDAFMFGIWFFTLYALLNSLVFSAGRLWNRKLDHNKWWLLWDVTVVLLLADTFYHLELFKDFYEKFFKYVGTPFIVLVPMILAIIQGIETEEKVEK